MDKIIYRPDNFYLRLFLWLLMFFLMTSGQWLLFLVTAGLYLASMKRGCLILDGFHASAQRHPFSREMTIIPREQLRAYTGKRKYGSCLILGDKTSVQEIVLYDWAFKAKTLKIIRETAPSKESS